MDAMTSQIKIKYVPSDIIKPAMMKEDPAYDILPTWAYAKLTYRDHERIGRELFYMHETNPPKNQGEKEYQMFSLYRDYWMEMTMEFMVDRDIDWTMHPRYTGDYMEEEREEAEYYYKMDMEYINSIVPHQMSTNEEKLVAHINAIGDIAACSEGAGTPLAAAQQDLCAEEQEVFEEATKLSNSTILGMKAEWMKKKARKAKIGIAVIKAGGRKKERAPVTDRAQGTPSPPSPRRFTFRKIAGFTIPARDYRKVRDSITDEEKEQIAREFASIAISDPPQVTQEKGTVSIAPSVSLAGGIGYHPGRKVTRKYPPSRTPHHYGRDPYPTQEGLLLIPSDDGEVDYDGDQS